MPRLLLPPPAVESPVTLPKSVPVGSSSSGEESGDGGAPVADATVGASGVTDGRIRAPDAAAPAAAAGVGGVAAASRADGAPLLTFAVLTEARGSIDDDDDDEDANALARVCRVCSTRVASRRARSRTDATSTFTPDWNTLEAADDMEAVDPGDAAAAAVADAPDTADPDPMTSCSTA